MTFMNKADPSDPDPEPGKPWMTVTAILLLGAVIALALLYRDGGSLFGLSSNWARALVVLLLMVVSTLAWLGRRRRARAAQRPS